MHGNTPPAVAADDIGADQLAYKVRKAARVLDLSERVVWELVRTGELPSFKVNNSRLIAVEDLRAYRDKLRAKGRAA